MTIAFKPVYRPPFRLVATGAVMWAAIICGILAVAGCGGPSGTVAVPTVAAPSPGVTIGPAVVTPAAPMSKNPIVAKSVAAAQQALTVLEKAALRYTSLPACGSTAKICADPATKERIKEYDRYAFDAVMKARRNEASLDFALAAINAFSNVIP